MTVMTLRRDDLPIGPKLPGAWHVRGKCQGRDDIDWFPDVDGAATSEEARELCADALALCGFCPVVRECREFAISTQQEYGVWGGLTEYDRGRKEPRRRAAQSSSGRRTARLVVVRPNCPGCQSREAVVPADASHLRCLDCAISWPAPLS